MMNGRGVVPAPSTGRWETRETRETREELVVVPIVNIEKRMLVKGLGFMVMMKVKECTKGVSKQAIVLQ